MLTFRTGSPAKNCQGATRRAALKAGFLGLAGLSLPDIRKAQAAGGSSGNRKSVILMWLDGGPSQLETFDPKPDAPKEYRGPFGVAKSRIPGMYVSELMPETAKRAHQVALIRSIHHDTGDHFAGAHWMTTGRFGATTANKAQKYPSVGSYVSRVKGANAPGVPAYVGLPSAETVYLFPGYMGAAYLGGQYEAFDVNRTQRYLSSKDARRVRSPEWLSSLGGATNDTIRNRTDLLAKFDHFRRDIDKSGTAAEMDQFQQQAIDLVLGSKAREAFDIDREDPRVADRYGVSPWGRYTLMARRLVEVGVSFVTVDMPHWDDHSNIEKGHAAKVPVVDKALGALLDDLSDRGLLESTLVLVMGEFGRTPRINTGQPGIPVPGRDHWGNAISVLMAGGGIPGGVIVGKTNANAEHPVQRAMKPDAVLATVFHHLGIDPTMLFPDHSGRPITMLDDPTPIEELV